MIGETREENDLFYLCSLLEYIARKTKNTKKYIVNKLGIDNLEKIYKLAEAYHSENIEKISDELIGKAKIEIGNYDIISSCNYRVPTYWEIGKVYKRLIIMVDNNKNNYIKTLIKVLSSWIIEKIDNYNSSMYYENPEYIYNCYLNNKMI